MLPTPTTGSSRRSPNLVISIPGTRQPATFRPHFKPSGKLLFRYLPWVVGCTILLWLFILRADNPPFGGGPGEGYRVPHYHPHSRPGPPGFPPFTRQAWRPPPGAGGDGGHEHPPPEDDHPGFKWKWGSGGASNKAKPQPQVGIWDTRAEKVKEAFVHAFEGYKRHAGGYDELLPIVGGKVNNFNGWGVTLYDALDTMWIMGLHDMFRDALETVAKADFYLKPDDYAPFFETTIRYLGGLLSAYALSGEPVLLTRADDLGRMLLPAFDSPSGFPMFAVNTKTGQTRKGWAGDALWAEGLSNQMEYKYLAHITGREEYYNKTDRVMQRMTQISLTNGLFPTRWDTASGTPTNQHYSVGAFADSAYEYMLKQWLLTGRSEPHALELYLNSTNAIIEHLLHLTPKRKLLYVTDLLSESPTHRLEHLSCFLPGLFALGVQTLPEDILPAKTRDRHLWAAQGLAETCWITYADTKTGLGPDEVTMEAWPPKKRPSAPPPTTTTPTADSTTTEMTPHLKDRAFWSSQSDEDIGGRWLDHVERWEREGRPGKVPPGAKTVPKETDPQKREWKSLKDSYLLRPETIESFYILWKTTGEVKWRERGWSVFEAIERHAKTKYGYASINNVDQVPPQWKDEMPSYFLAETLKYLYLLFIDDDIISSEYWVFNTEAHPLPIFDWTPWEKQAYGLNTTATSTTAATSTTTSNDESPNKS
ncbi:hypothetical protein H1R20_g6105, partial [Candolleomyces eurysporus]